MNKLVKKFQFVSMHEVGPYESWLSDMAEKGLFLEKIGNMFCKFEKREPEKMEYRVEVSKDKITRERTKLYEESGWKYVARYRWWHVFSAPAAEEYVEIHTDSAEQGFTLEEVTKRMRIATTVIILDMICMVALMIYFFNIGHTPYLNLIEGGVMFITNAFIMIFLIIFMMKQSRECSNLKRQLFCGKAIDHHASYKKNQIHNKVILFINVFMCAVIIINNVFILRQTISMISGSYEYSLTEEKNNLPIVRLANIEENDNLVLAVRDKNSDFNYDNYVRTDISILTFAQYEVEERGIVVGELWDDWSAEYAPSLHTEYYELVLSFMAEGVLKDLIYKNIDTNEGLYEVEITEISFGELDHVYLVEEKESKRIFASKNNKVIYVGYYGKKDIMLVVEEVAAILK